MKTYPRLIQKLFFDPLLVLPSTYSTFERALLNRLGFPSASQVIDPWAREIRAHEDNPDLEGEDNEPRPQTAADRQQRRIDAILTIYSNVAVISVDGVIDKRLSDFEIECYGGVDLADLDAAISQIRNNGAITDVVFDFNTPGGSAAGVPETSARIRSLGDYKNKGGAAKQTHARVDVLCCSAGQWLASQCDIVTACPTATVGSVGVYCALLDETGWLEKEGLKVNLIKAGKYKAMGASFKALEDDEREMLQQRVLKLWAEFKTDVQYFREVDDDDMQGQTFRGDEAKKKGLVTQVSDASLDEYVSRLITD